jgi:hypothetical protein
MIACMHDPAHWHLPHSTARSEARSSIRIEASAYDDPKILFTAHPPLRVKVHSAKLQPSTFLVISGGEHCFFFVHRHDIFGFAAWLLFACSLSNIGVRYPHANIHTTFNVQRPK